MAHRTYFLFLLTAWLSWTGAYADFRDEVEADWKVQLLQRETGPKRAPTPETDAAGGCDGVKDGKWGFHTENQEGPWWQVDLGGVKPLDRVVLWNRCDAAARNDNIIVQVSEDGSNWRDAYTHNGPTFYGKTDGRPLSVPLAGCSARYVRLTLRAQSWLHLDEVEVFGAADPVRNIALRRPAVQSSISQWSADHRPRGKRDMAWPERIAAVVKRSRELVEIRRGEGVDVSRHAAALARLERELAELPARRLDRGEYERARWLQRRLLLADPLLDFGEILFATRVPGSFNHMSDQYYGWFSRPGGDLCLLGDYTTDRPKLSRITEGLFDPAGSFLRPSLSYDGKKVLFAWCRFHPGLAEHPDKFNKDNVPEDAFYHVFEMNLDGTGLRQITRGKYDDFDARYLPDGRIVFLSTRRGQFVQTGAESAALTMENPALPDCYVRCGGGPERPVAVYTLHTMNADGTAMNAISPFEMFEWTPSISRDGTILYSRWDYIDRWNMPYMSLWSIHPDGTHSRIVYKNYTLAPHCTFEPQCVPNSDKIVFTGSAHHAQTMGSLVLLDTAAGTEGGAPVRRLTPEVVFPEIEGWPATYYASPWPLSERLYLVSWGVVPNPTYPQVREKNDMGLYLYDADSGQLELLYRSAEFASEWPLPVAARPAPPPLVDTVPPDAPREGRYLVADVYKGLPGVERGSVKALRLVAVPAKTHPTMNYPVMGLTADDPGKCVLGTVPVEPDGSAYFRAPSGVTMFFQALDGRGMAVQTMRGAVHVQPGQTMGCVGCHEHRLSAPVSNMTEAARRDPSRVTPGPEGSWPYRFDRMVQPVLDRNCVECHRPGAEDRRGAEFDLTPGRAWENLCNYGGGASLAKNVRDSYARGHSIAGQGPSHTSPLLALLDSPGGHYGVSLAPEDFERLITWMDTYGQRLGSYSEEQEMRLEELRESSRDLLAER